MSFSPIEICLLKHVRAVIDPIPCEMKSISPFSLQKRSSSKCRTFLADQQLLARFLLTTDYFPGCPRHRQVLFQCILYFLSMKRAFPTLSQLVPATRQETSPPRRFAAAMALRVMGVRVSLLCSATTKVLWHLRSTDACKEGTHSSRKLSTEVKTAPLRNP